MSLCRGRTVLQGDPFCPGVLWGQGWLWLAFLAVVHGGRGLLSFHRHFLLWLFCRYCFDIPPPDLQ